MKKITKIMGAITLISAALCLTCACGGGEETSDSIECLDTLCTITIYDQSEDKAQEIIEQAFDQCEDLEDTLSKTVQGSDVDLINCAEGKSVKVSDDTIAVIKKGLYYSELSDGAFDITVGRITDLWDFKAENPQVPSEDALTEAAATVDYTQVKVKGNKVTLANPEAKLDLGGIAKGYIADQLETVLRDNGVGQAIINLGGNVVTIGSKEDDMGWNVGIERPYSDRTEIIGAVEMTDETIVTSGIYERMFEKDGTIYHHIIDPSTGMPSTSDVEAVSIMAEDGHSVDCDALSTICLLLGQEKGMELIESLDGFEASFMDRDDNVTTTDGMKMTLIQQ